VKIYFLQGLQSYKIDYGIIRLIHDAGHEIGVHGYNHDGKLYSSMKVFDERVPFINKAMKKFKSVGFRSPMVHHAVPVR